MPYHTTHVEIKVIKNVNEPMPLAIEDHHHLNLPQSGHFLLVYPPHMYLPQSDHISIIEIFSYEDIEFDELLGPLAYVPTFYCKLGLCNFVVEDLPDSPQYVPRTPASII